MRALPSKRAAAVLYGQAFRPVHPLPGVLRRNLPRRILSQSPAGEWNMSESEYGAHYRCVWCHAVKAKADIIFVDENKPICGEGDCKDAYYAKTRPRPAARYPGNPWDS